MDFIRVRLIEKIQLQAVALAALVGVYSLLAARVSPWDPQAPVTLLSQPGIGRLVVLAAGVWVLAAAAGALTVSARPEGPLLAALAGAAGVALYSPGIRPLLMARQDALRGLFFAHLLEVVALAAVVLAAGRIASFVRGRASRLAGGWGWRDPLQQLTDEQRRTIGEIDVDRMAWVGGPVAMVRIGLTMLLSKTGKAGARKQAQDGQETPSLKRLLGCLAISAVVSDYAGDVEDRFGVRSTLVLIPLGIAFLYLLPPLVPLLAFPMFFVMKGGFTLVWPVSSRYMNDRIDSVGRATVLSVASMLRAVAGIPFRIASGVVADHTTTMLAVAALGATFIVSAVALVWFAEPVRAGTETASPAD